MKNKPEEITVCELEVVVMPNGEVICLGKTVGWFKELAKFLTPKGERTAEMEAIASCSECRIAPCINHQF